MKKTIKNFAKRGIALLFALLLLAQWDALAPAARAADDKKAEEKGTEVEPTSGSTKFVTWDFVNPQNVGGNADFTNPNAKYQRAFIYARWKDDKRPYIDVTGAALGDGISRYSDGYDNCSSFCTNARNCSSEWNTDFRDYDYFVTKDGLHTPYIKWWENHHGHAFQLWPAGYATDNRSNYVITTVDDYEKLDVRNTNGNTTSPSSWWGAENKGFNCYGWIMENGRIWMYDNDKGGYNDDLKLKDENGWTAYCSDNSRADYWYYYFGHEYFVPTLTNDFTIGVDQIKTFRDSYYIPKGKTITVQSGAVLSIDGILLNDGKIVIEDGGMLVLNEKAVIMPFTKYDGACGTVISRGNIVVRSNAMLAGGGSTGLKFESGTVINYGTILSENLTISQDYVIENHSAGAVYGGKMLARDKRILVLRDYLAGTKSGISSPSTGTYLSGTTTTYKPYGVYDYKTFQKSSRFTIYNTEKKLSSTVASANAAQGGTLAAAAIVAARVPLLSATAVAAGQLPTLAAAAVAAGQASSEPSFTGQTTVAEADPTLTIYTRASADDAHVALCSAPVSELGCRFEGNQAIFTANGWEYPVSGALVSATVTRGADTEVLFRDLAVGVSGDALTESAFAAAAQAASAVTLGSGKRYLCADGDGVRMASDAAAWRVEQVSTGRVDNVLTPCVRLVAPTGKVLAAADGGVALRAAAKNASKSQLWYMRKSEDGYFIVSAAEPTLALVAGGRGAALRAYAGEKDQCWTLAAAMGGARSAQSAAVETTDDYGGKVFTLTARTTGERLAFSSEKTCATTAAAYASAAQQWRFTRVGTTSVGGVETPYYRVVNVHSRQALTCDEGFGAYSRVSLADYVPGNRAQLWLVDASATGLAALVPLGNTSRVLCADGAGVYLGSLAESAPYARWRLSETVAYESIGSYRLSPKSAPSQSLTIAGESDALGARVTLRAAAEESGDWESWTFTRMGSDAGGDYYKISNDGSGMVLDLSGTAAADGKALQQWYFDENNDQLWYMADMGGGDHVIVNRSSGQAFGLAAAGGAAIVAARTQSDAQLWQLTELKSAPEEESYVNRH